MYVYVYVYLLSKQDEWRARLCWNVPSMLLFFCPNDVRTHWWLLTPMSLCQALENISLKMTSNQSANMKYDV